MNQYEVEIRFTGHFKATVFASSEEEAMKLAKDGYGEWSEDADEWAEWDDWKPVSAVLKEDNDGR